MKQAQSQDEASIMQQYIREEVLREQSEEVPRRLHDEHHAEYKHVSELALPIDRIPQDILSRANKVFSKHPAKDVREWAALLMKSYQLLHAVEKPINFDYVKPYANTSDLKNFTPTIDHNQAYQKAKSRLEATKSDEPTIDVDFKPHRSKVETEEEKEK